MGGIKIPLISKVQKKKKFFLKSRILCGLGSSSKCACEKMEERGRKTEMVENEEAGILVSLGHGRKFGTIMTQYNK